MWQLIGRGAVIAAGMVLAASYGGDFHAVGDSLAVFRGAILMGCAVCAVLVWRWAAAQVLLLAVVCISIFQLSDGAFARTPEQPDLTLYQKNLLYFERDRAAFIADVLASDADVVTLQEISPSNEAVLDALREVFPHQLLCNERGQRTTAVLSRTSLLETECLDAGGTARVLTKLNGEDVQVYSVHLYWPWPHNQARQVDELSPILFADRTERTVIGGDFNMAPRGRSIATIEKVTNTRRVGRAVATYDLYGYPLAIDHVLASGGSGTIEARDKLGSDHRGVLARIAWP